MGINLAWARTLSTSSGFVFRDTSWEQSYIVLCPLVDSLATFPVSSLQFHFFWRIHFVLPLWNRNFCLLSMIFSLPHPNSSLRLCFFTNLPSFMLFNTKHVLITYRFISPPHVPSLSWRFPTIDVIVPFECSNKSLKVPFLELNWTTTPKRYSSHVLPMWPANATTFSMLKLQT